jgi:DNA-binding PadR family transcriptional regulator
MGWDGDALGFDHLEEINNLVFHIWDAAVLHCLQIAREPLRYSDIGAAVDQWSQRRPSDSDLTRSLDRLRKGGFVNRTEAGTRRSRIYTLTSKGHERAGKIGALIQVLETTNWQDDLTQAQYRNRGATSDYDDEGGKPT